MSQVIEKVEIERAIIAAMFGAEPKPNGGSESRNLLNAATSLREASINNVKGAKLLEGAIRSWLDLQPNEYVTAMAFLSEAALHTDSTFDTYRRLVEKIMESQSK